MKTYVQLWQYLAEFFIEWEMMQTKVAEKIKTHISRSIIVFLSKIMPLMTNVEKYFTAGQATDGSITRRRALRAG